MPGFFNGVRAGTSALSAFAVSASLQSVSASPIGSDDEFESGNTTTTAAPSTGGGGMSSLELGLVITAAVLVGGYSLSYLVRYAAALVGRVQNSCAGSRGEETCCGEDAQGCEPVSCCPSGDCSGVTTCLSACCSADSDSDWGCCAFYKDPVRQPLVLNSDDPAASPGF